jgi:hypothetical protein
MAKQTIEIATRPGLIPVLCYIEDLPFGKILRQLHDTQGIDSVDVLLGQGGKQSPLTPDDIAAHQIAGNLKQQVITILARGPHRPAALAAALGRKTTTIYSALTALKNRGIAESNGDGWRLIAQAMAAARGNGHDVAAPIALPAPAKVNNTPSGRAEQGAGAKILLAVLASGPRPSSDIRAAMAQAGMSTKSISGVLARGRDAGIVKHDPKNGVYELTARGIKQAGEAAHG